MRLVEKAARKKPESEELLLEIPKEYNQEVKPFLNKELNISVEKEGEDIVIHISKKKQ
jgi:uncharacterized FlaG/YvyC family protein